jgi:cytochrome c oxidase assembly protein subunit 15
MANATPPLVDLEPLLLLLLLGLVLAAFPLAWLAWRHRHAPAAARLSALTALTVFLTFDLVVFGSFTRLTDSGLGCPDWPGCYGSASPLGAREEIQAAETALPTGPVTHGKAWIEMIHRYLATMVGALILALAVLTTVAARRQQSQPASSERVLSPIWAWASLVWVIVQGAFGALTVTMKLYPAIVTIHLLGGLGLLALLAVQAQSYVQRPLSAPPRMAAAATGVGLALAAQIALGGWVSTNYAVLACSDFPTCQGQWWPPMQWAEGFDVVRPLGQTDSGDYLPFAALTAIHMAHRIGAVVLCLGVAVLVLTLWRLPGAAPRRWAWLWLALLAWQLTSGLSNVVLGWPLLAALAHSAGAAAMVLALAVLGTRLWQGQQGQEAQRGLQGLKDRQDRGAKTPAARDHLRPVSRAANADEAATSMAGRS